MERLPSIYEQTRCCGRDKAVAMLYWTGALERQSGHWQRDTGRDFIPDI